jgi:Tfp pilus assembly protein PilZ
VTTSPPKSAVGGPCTPIEPRFFARAAVDAPLVLAFEADRVAGRAVNVSEGGVRAELVAPVAPGSMALCEISLPGEAEVTAGVAEVVWCRPEGPPERPHAVGLAFVELDEADAEAIRRYVERTEPLFWE